MARQSPSELQWRSTLRSSSFKKERNVTEQPLYNIENIDIFKQPSFRPLYRENDRDPFGATLYPSRSPRNVPTHTSNTIPEQIESPSSASIAGSYQSATLSELSPNQRTLHGRTHSHNALDLLSTRSLNQSDNVNKTWSTSAMNVDLTSPISCQTPHTVKKFGHTRTLNKSRASSFTTSDYLSRSAEQPSTDRLAFTVCGSNRNSPHTLKSPASCVDLFYDARSKLATFSMDRKSSKMSMVKSVHDFAEAVHTSPDSSSTLSAPTHTETNNSTVHGIHPLISVHSHQNIQIPVATRCDSHQRTRYSPYSPFISPTRPPTKIYCSSPLASQDRTNKDRTTSLNRHDEVPVYSPQTISVRETVYNALAGKTSIGSQSNLSKPNKVNHHRNESKPSQHVTLGYNNCSARNQIASPCDSSEGSDAYSVFSDQDLFESPHHDDPLSNQTAQM